jgi:hypothetical protein
MYGSLMAPLVSLFRFYERVHELDFGVLENAVMVSDRSYSFVFMYYYVV